MNNTNYEYSSFYKPTTQNKTLLSVITTSTNTNAVYLRVQGNPHLICIFKCYKEK